MPLLLLVPAFSAAQGDSKAFSKIDAYTRQIKTYKDPGDLAHKLVKPYTTELQKVRSIFFWIADNISYDVKEFHACDSGAYKGFSMDTNEAGTLSGDRYYNYQVVQHVLKTKKGICDGYSRLFKTLCDSAGIKSEMVIGMGKNSSSYIGIFDSNHAWNSVMIDKKWYLLDACWASGSCDDSVLVFTKGFDPFYFLTDPKKFSYDHFPDNKSQFYMDRPPTKEQFISYPMVYPKYHEYAFDGFFPSSGLITGKEGEKIKLQLTMKEDSPIELSGSFNVELKKVEKKLYYEYTIKKPPKNELIVFYNYKAILAYKVEVKN